MSRNLSAIHHCALAAAVFFGVARCAGVASANVTGFGDGSSYTLNGYDTDDFGNITNSNDPPTISGGALTITDTTGSAARSAFYNTPQNLASFTASFVFQDTNQSPLGAADGFCFVVQSQGLNAIGGNSPGLGFTINGSNQPPTGPGINPIAPGAGEEFYLRNGTGATDFGVNGSGSFADATSTSPVDLADGDPIAITLAYDDVAKTLTETMIDQTTLDTYVLTRSADITAVVGNSGYVGFTGSTGGAYSTQTITDFAFTSVPEPASIGLFASGALCLITRRRRA